MNNYSTVVFFIKAEYYLDRSHFIKVSLVTSELLVNLVTRMVFDSGRLWTAATGVRLASNLVKRADGRPFCLLMRLHMHCESHHRSSALMPFKGNYCFKWSSRRHLGATACGSVREGALRQTESFIFPLQLELKCFHTPTVSSGSRGYMFSVCGWVYFVGWDACKILSSS